MDKDAKIKFKYYSQLQIHFQLLVNAVSINSDNILIKNRTYV